jgi:hypothetical protein
VMQYLQIKARTLSNFMSGMRWRFAGEHNNCAIFISRSMFIVQYIKLF